MFRVEKLSFAYKPESPLFEELSFALDPCKSIVLMGENGCGKSTLLRILTGMLKPHSGKILIGNEVIGSRQSIANAIYYHAQSATENIVGINAEADLKLWQIALKNEKHTIPKDRIYDLWNFGELRNTPIFQLSTGEQRTLSLLPISLLMDRYWLLDEPFAGLDEKRAGILENLLIQKHRSNIGMLVISHNLAICRSFADEIWTMDRGMITRTVC